jgi:hypothetical protein
MYLFAIMINVYHDGVVLPNVRQASDKIYADSLPWFLRDIMWLKYQTQVLSGLHSLASVAARDKFLHESGHAQPPI